MVLKLFDTSEAVPYASATLSMIFAILRWLIRPEFTGKVATKIHFATEPADFFEYS